MRRRMSVLICALLLGLAVVACDDDGTLPASEEIRGTVVDEDGAPIADAVILTSHEIEAGGLAAEKPQTRLDYSLPEAAHCHVWIETPCGEVIRTLVDEVLPAGLHSFVWDARDDQGLGLSDGLYVSKARIGDSVEVDEDEVILMDGAGYLDATDPAAWRPRATTDAQGRFSLAQECLGFGRSVTGTDETGNPTGTLTVTRNVRLWALCEGRLPGGSDWITVDPRRGAEVTIRAGGPAQ